MSQVATDSYRTAGTSAAVPNGLAVLYYLPERKTRIAVARVDDSLYAFGDICTCGEQGCPLSRGLLSETTVICPRHGSRWDLTTGAVIDGPATQPLEMYEVREVDNEIQVRV